ncbi:hypothetical protein ASPVEDRAFT_507992 [Aspergillus versicolor CBS 583.65]|uniref:CDC48 N-terminal subdomain domain-containing protein n=1 Tax=Aspergillus versicolor CBS 583.65 TaxID=1036611 RepID=A0A1L9PCR7_ASPVE|nr:uncharacterized protein ASPVEDRAFT_507992 [Aspergillus versicolor CBS 583.65]OJI99273.1 hypothetical protein ASPVEDRAFT_507992 [Aspergillus versicolor CBS 583.65]
MNSVIDAVNQDNSVITLSANTMEVLQLQSGDTVLVKESRDKTTALIVISDNKMEDGYACVNHVVRNNLGIKHGDIVRVYPCDDIKYAKHIAIRPVLDTMEGFTGSLFEDYLAPYFRDHYRPVHQDDLFTIQHDDREVEFKVIELDPPEYGIVEEQTLIHCDASNRQHCHRIRTRPRQVPWDPSSKFLYQYA